MTPILLWQILHCKHMNHKSLKCTGTCENNTGTSRRIVSHTFKVKTERRDFEFKQSTCRICLKSGDIPIYGCIDLSEELKIFTSIEVRRNDSYPQYLCESCNAVLESAIALRKTAQHSDQLLKQPTQEDMHIEVTPDFDTDSDNDQNNWLETEKFQKRINSEEYLSDFDCEHRKRKEKQAHKEKGRTKLEDILHEIEENKDAKENFEQVRTKTLHCLQCNMTFDTMEAYSSHRLSAEHDELRRACPICNNSYTSAYLKKHLSLHKKEKPYMCDVCGKKFAIRGQFTRHRVTHFIVELPFKCSVCPYRGRFKENLKLHMRTHTNDKRYPCSQCSARFINKSNLSQHLLTHKTDHDFKCDQCLRGFNKKRDLEMHFRVDHGGEKDHVCDLCGKAFGFRQQMMKHQRKVHKREKRRGGKTPLYMLLDSKKQNEDSSFFPETNELSNDD